MQAIPANVAPLLEWARALKRPVTVFDVETTTNNPYVVWLGITELGYITFHPDGHVQAKHALVNPERDIPRDVSLLTGIWPADVADQPTWAAWASTFHAMAEEHVMVGFNSQAFDGVVVQLQNARYGVMGTNFAHALDARALPDVFGTLPQAAERLGLCVRSVRRAMDDAWLTAQLVAKVTTWHGLAALDACVGVRLAWSHLADPARWAALGPRAAREAFILEHYKKSGALPDLSALAKRHGVKRSTIEGDVFRLAESGKIPRALLDRPRVQAFLRAHLEAAIAATWTDDSVGRLKPLFTYLEPQAPDGFDYTQLRIALARHKAGRATAA